MNLLRAGFRRDRQPDKKPTNEERDSEKLRQRGRNVGQRAAEHAAKSGADKAKKTIDSAGHSSARSWHMLAQKRGQYRLIYTVAEHKHRAADIKQKIVLSAEQINSVTDRGGEPTDEKRHVKTAQLLCASHVRKDKKSARKKNDRIDFPELCFL